MLRWLRRHVRGKQGALEAVLRRLDAGDRNDGTVDVNGLAAALACVGIPLPDDRLGALVCIANDHHDEPDSHDDVDVKSAEALRPRSMNRFWYASFTQDRLRSWEPRLVARTTSTNKQRSRTGNSPNKSTESPTREQQSKSTSPRRSTNSKASIAGVAVNRSAPRSASVATATTTTTITRRSGRGGSSRPGVREKRSTTRRQPVARKPRDSKSDMSSQTPVWWRDAAATESNVQAAQGSIVVHEDHTPHERSVGNNGWSRSSRSISASKLVKEGTTDLDAESHWSEFAASESRHSQHDHQHDHRQSQSLGLHHSLHHQRDQSPTDATSQQQQQAYDGSHHHDVDADVDVDVTKEHREVHHGRAGSSLATYEATRQTRTTSRLRARDAEAACLRGRLAKRMALIAAQERAASAVLGAKLKACTLSEEAMRAKWAMLRSGSKKSALQPNNAASKPSARASTCAVTNDSFLDHYGDVKHSGGDEGFVGRDYNHSMGLIDAVLTPDTVREIQRYRAAFAQHRRVEREAALTDVVQSERELVETLADGVLEQLIDSATRELWAASDDIASQVFGTL
jgi:hypothetical protein